MQIQSDAWFVFEDKVESTYLKGLWKSFVDLHQTCSMDILLVYTKTSFVSWFLLSTEYQYVRYVAYGSSRHYGDGWFRVNQLVISKVLSLRYCNSLLVEPVIVEIVEKYCQSVDGRKWKSLTTLVEAQRKDDTNIPNKQIYWAVRGLVYGLKVVLRLEDIYNTYISALAQLYLSNYEREKSRDIWSVGFKMFSLEYESTLMSFTWFAGRRYGMNKRKNLICIKRIHFGVMELMGAA